MVRGLTVVLLSLLLLSAPAHAGQPTALPQRRAEVQTSVDTVSRSVMCPSCEATLDQSASPAAERMRIWIDARVRAGWTEQEIRDGLVAEYDGDRSILATPGAADTRGQIAWLVPAGVGLAALVVGAATLLRWRRRSQSARAGR